MRKVFACFTICVILSASGIVCGAAENVNEVSGQVSQASGERSMLTRLGDWYATVGKSPEEKARILEERQAKRTGLTTEDIAAQVTSMAAATSQAAIRVSQSLATTKEKVNYLVGQARDMYNSEKFQDTIDIAQHVLVTLDKDSPAAQQLLQDAKSKLASKVQATVQDAQKKLGGLMGNVQ